MGISSTVLEIRRKRLTIGVVDLLTNRPQTSPYAKIVNPNYSSLMPQFVSVWLEELGHDVHYVSYTGFEDLHAELPRNTDIIFISSFTQAALLAYSISNLFREEGVITVLGGPHARAYTEDAKLHFDYVLGLTDKPLIKDLLADFSPNPREGIYLEAKSQLKSVPGVKERWKFIQTNLKKARFFQAVPMIGSLGCPYSCNFCVDATSDYQTLPYEQIKEDLDFLQRLPKPPMVGWYDPNFGVRFDEYMDLIEEAVPAGRIAFGGESSLSILTEKNLKRMKKNKFAVMLPGIESWFGFGNKSKQTKSFGLDKVHHVSEQLNMIMRYIPYIQTNLIFGLDCDEGPLPFELTKKMVDLCPGVFPNFALITSFGQASPLDRQFQEEGRVLDIPFHFLDGVAALNIRLKNYDPEVFYSHLIDLNNYAFSAKRIYKRFRTNKQGLPRWINLLRAVFSTRGSSGNFGQVRDLISKDRDFRRFYTGESPKPPAYYTDQVRRDLGIFYEKLPEHTKNYLNHGEEAPNTRIKSEKACLPKAVSSSGV